jgi:DNA-directed RNA polymerase subunit K/omega
MAEEYDNFDEELDDIDEEDIDEDDADADADADASDADAEEEEDLYYEKDRYATDMTVKIVAPHNRRTSNRISLFEFVNVVGTRAQQIEGGDEFYIPIGTHTSSMEIAEAEVRAGKCPFIVERKLATQGYVQYVEHFSVNEMILPVA